MPRKKIQEGTTLEADAYLGGLFQDFEQQMQRYKALTAALMGLEARLGLAEKTLSLTRDHLKMALQTTEGGANLWDKYKRESAKVRFVGMRLVDVCEQVIAEHKKTTPEKLLDGINEGTFRFKTNSPLREIHAALLRHPHIRRVGNYYIWAGPKEDRLAVLQAAESGAPAVIEGELTADKEPGAKPN